MFSSNICGGKKIYLFLCFKSGDSMSQDTYMQISSLCIYSTILFTYLWMRAKGYYLAEITSFDLEGNSAHAEGSMWVVGCVHRVSQNFFFSHTVNFFISIYAKSSVIGAVLSTELQPSSSGTSVDSNLYIYHNKQEIPEFIAVHFFFVVKLTFLHGQVCSVIIYSLHNRQHFWGYTTTATSRQHLARALTLKDRLDDVVAWFPEQWIIINKCIRSKHCVAKTICPPFVVFLFWISEIYIYISSLFWFPIFPLFRSPSSPADKQSSSREDGFMHPSVITGT